MEPEVTPSVTSMYTEMKIYLQYDRIDRTCERSINAHSVICKSHILVSLNNTFFTIT